MRESRIEAYLVKQVKALGGMAPKYKSPGRNNVPDRLVLLPDAIIDFIECKAPGEQPTEAQVREHNRLRKLGFTVLVIDSNEAVDSYIESRGS